LVKAPIDIFFLKYRDVYRLPGFNDRSTQKLFDECQKAKTTPFTNVLFALGIPHVGLAIARNIVNKFKNIDNIISAKAEELIQTPLVGQEVANSIEMFFKNDDNLIVIQQLKQLGFNMSNNSE
jgi:DNA ligase (NAD+)